MIKHITNFNLYQGLDIDENTKKYLEIQDEVNNIIVNLMTRRIKLGLTMQNLSKMADVNLKDIRRIEQFKTCPNLETVFKLDRALKNWGYKNKEEK